jgi:hypothetical protein
MVSALGGPSDHATAPALVVESALGGRSDHVGEGCAPLSRGPAQKHITQLALAGGNIKLSVGFGIESKLFNLSERSNPNPNPKTGAPFHYRSGQSSSRPITARYMRVTSYCTPTMCSRERLASELPDRPTNRPNDQPTDRPTTSSCMATTKRGTDTRLAAAAGANGEAAEGAGANGEAAQGTAATRNAAERTAANENAAKRTAAANEHVAEGTAANGNAARGGGG